LSDTQEKIIEIIASFSPVDREKITLETNLTDIEIESLEFVELVFQLEEEFDVSIPYNANEVGKFKNVEDIVFQVSSIIEEQNGFKE
tara:strand:- start:10042 stop:10302 length:261 start_codon:yes stop_codon:yes gene_type:complete